MGDGSDGAFACRNAPYKIRDRTRSPLMAIVSWLRLQVVDLSGNHLLKFKFWSDNSFWVSAIPSHSQFIKMIECSR
jgi:hypothetical protein